MTGSLSVRGGISASGRNQAFAGTIYLNAARRANLVLGGTGLTTLQLGSDDTNDYTFTNLHVLSGGVLEIDGNPAE